SSSRAPRAIRDRCAIFSNQNVQPTHIPPLMPYTTLFRSPPPDPLKKLPYLVIIIDELADLMMVASREVETYIARLAIMRSASSRSEEHTSELQSLRHLV